MVGWKRAPLPAPVSFLEGRRLRQPPCFAHDPARVPPPRGNVIMRWVLHGGSAGVGTRFLPVAPHDYRWRISYG